jgi:hypothetical protein
MKNIQYIFYIASILLTFELNAQDVKVEKIEEPVIVQPPPTIINPNPTSELQGFIGDRLVFWVHGLGGDMFSWDRAGEYIGDNYKITSVLNTMDYSVNSLSGAGQIVQNTIDGLAVSYGEINEIEDNDINFIIAHSQGGLVSRAAYKRYADLNVLDERSFGGIVTFGTPHQGAQLLNNVPLFLDFIENSCNDLSEGPLLEQWNGNWLLSFFPSNGFEEAIHTICDNFSHKIVPFMMADYLTPITDDYNVGSTYLEELNEFDEELEDSPEANIPRVSFYGVEEAPVVWRTVYSILNDVNEEEAFQANYDDELIDKANQNQNMYYMKYMAYKNLYDLTTTDCADIVGFVAYLPFAHWFLCLPGVLNEDYNEYGDLIVDQVVWFPYNYNDIAENRDAYYNGYRWWTDVEENYLSLIGAVEYLVDGCHCDCLEKYGSDPTPYIVLHDIDCDDNCDNIENNPPPNTNVIHCDYAVVYEKHIKPNDGIVLVESAQNYPGSDNGSDNAMLGSNHLQMRNDGNTGLTLSELMFGNHGQYYTTEER